jgi:hypothetical protein
MWLSILNNQNLVFLVVHSGVFILGTTLSVGCEFEMELKRLSMWKGSPEINSRGGLVWLLTFCAASTKSVIKFYWEVQWTCGFLHWKVDFRNVPWSTHAALELSGFKSYYQIIMKVRTCPNWLSELIYMVLFHCFLSLYSCTTPLTYIPKYNQCRIFR